MFGTSFLEGFVHAYEKIQLILDVGHQHKRIVGKEMFDEERPQKTCKLIRGFGQQLLDLRFETVSRF